MAVWTGITRNALMRNALMMVSLSALMLPGNYICEAAAQNAEVDFNVPRGGLGAVITAIAAAGGQPISFPSDLASGRLAGPIKGRKSVRAALAQALAGSGLSIAESGGGLTVVADKNNRAYGVNANAATDIADIDVVGTKTGDVGFVAGQTASSTRNEAPLQETPLSITGVTKDVIATQAATSVFDAAKNVSSVTLVPSSGSQVAPTYSVRGISQVAILEQGQPTGIYTTIPLQDVERIDVIKGPTTILTGGPAMGAGGINLITKQPTATTIREVSAYLGSFGYKTIGLDLGGVVPQTEGVTFRFNASANTADQNYGGYKSPGEFLFSPALRWEDSLTQVEGGIRLIRERITPSPFTFFPGGPYGAQPFSMGRAEVIGSADAHSTVDTIQPYFSVQRVLGNANLGRFGTAEMTVHSRTQYTHDAFNSDIFGLGSVTTATEQLTLNPRYTQIRDGNITTLQDITVKHDAGFLRQSLQFGVDYRFYDISQVNNALVYAPYSVTIPFASIATTTLPLAPPVDAKPSLSQTENIGFSFQDNIDLFERLHILGAVRRDSYHAASDTAIGTSPDTFKDYLSKNNQRAVSYQTGAAYDVLAWATAYGTVGTGFLPNSAVLYNGEPAPPILSTNKEVGLKTAWFDKKLVVTGSLHEISYSNTVVRTSFGNISGPGFIGRGTELDVQGQITPNLAAIGSFSFSRYNLASAALSQYSGDRVFGQPNLTGSAFLNYTFLEGPIRGFSIGAGGSGFGVSWAPPPSGSTSLRVPGYEIADFYLGFHRDSYDVNFKLGNVFNKFYYIPSASSTYLPIGEGRNAMLVVKHQF